MDARQIATLARAGLTDEQIDTVLRVTAAAANPKDEPTNHNAPAPHIAEHHEIHKRNMLARAKILAVIARSPCSVEYLAQQAYGATDTRSVNCTNRMVQRLISDGFVSMNGGLVRLASGTPSRTEVSSSTLPSASFTLKATDESDLPAKTRRKATMLLCEAIRSDVVRAGGKVSGTIAQLTAPHRKLLEQTCVGLDSISNVPFAQRIASRRGSDGSCVIGGLRFVRDGSASTGNGLISLWTVSAV